MSAVTIFGDGTFGQKELSRRSPDDRREQGRGADNADECTRVRIHHLSRQKPCRAPVDEWRSDDRASHHPSGHRPDVRAREKDRNHAFGWMQKRDCASQDDEQESRKERHLRVKAIPERRLDSGEVPDETLKRSQENERVDQVSGTDHPLPRIFEETEHSGGEE